MLGPSLSGEKLGPHHVTWVVRTIPGERRALVQEQCREPPLSPQAGVPSVLGSGREGGSWPQLLPVQLDQ